MEFGIYFLEFTYFCAIKFYKMTLRKAYLIVFIILLVDQLSKIYIKTNFVYGESGQIDVTSWFKILLIENEGMAWGTVIPGTYGKLFLTVFRLVAVTGIGYWLWDSVEKKHSSNYLIVAISLILAGAFGNIIDSVLPSTVSAIAARYDMSFAAVQKHVAVLEEAGLVSKEVRGRERIVRSNPECIAQARALLLQLEQLWISRLSQLDELLAEPTTPSAD